MKEAREENQSITTEARGNIQQPQTEDIATSSTEWQKSEKETWIEVKNRKKKEATKTTADVAGEE